MDRQEEIAKEYANARASIPLACESWLSANQIFIRQQKPRLPRRLVYTLLDELATLGAIDTLQIGYMTYYRNHPERLELIDLPSASAYNDSQRSKSSLDADVDYLYQSIHQLANGKSVLIWMDMPAKPRKQTSRVVNRKLVCLVPGTAFNEPRDILLVAIIGAGSCLIRPQGKQSIANLVLAGMPAKLAQALMNAVRRIFI